MKHEQFKELLHSYWENLNPNSKVPIVDIILPEFIENSSKSLVLSNMQSIHASALWRKNATAFVLQQNHYCKDTLLKLLEEEIHFQNFLWDKRRELE